jgi:hypothetical protein
MSRNSTPITGLSWIVMYRVSRTYTKQIIVRADNKEAAESLALKVMLSAYKGVIELVDVKCIDTMGNNQAVIILI